MYCVFVGEKNTEGPPGLLVYYPGQAPQAVEPMKAWVRQLGVLPENVRYAIRGPLDHLFGGNSPWAAILPPEFLQASSRPIAVAWSRPIYDAVTPVPRTDIPHGQRGSPEQQVGERDGSGFSDIPAGAIDAEGPIGSGPWDNGSPEQGTWSDVVQHGGAFFEVPRQRRQQ